MIEQYVFNKITDDTTLQGLLAAGGSDNYHLYPTVVPRMPAPDFDRAVTFTTIVSTDRYPNVKSVNVQFNIFAKKHSEIVEIAQALYALFNEDNNDSEAGVNVVYSQRVSESDLGYDYNDTLYQREATYYFKLR